MLVEDGHPAYFLDGDNLRHGLSGDLGFSPADRTENIRRVAHVARLMADAGMVAIASLVSPAHHDRALARELHAAARLPFLEVYVDTPLEVCEARDPKGLYARARAGKLDDFTGVSAPYEAPETPDVLVHGADRGDRSSAAREDPRPRSKTPGVGLRRLAEPPLVRAAKDGGSCARRVIAHLDCDAFYVSVELLRRPGPGRQAGRRRRQRAARRRHDRLLRGAQVRRRLGLAGRQARRLCPHAIFIPPDFAAYRAKSREVWELSRERLPVVSSRSGSTRATPTSRMREAAARAARARRRGAGATGITISVGVGPNRLIAKVASDLEKPRGFVAMGREEACRRLASALAADHPRDRPEDRRAAGCDRLHDDRRAPARRRG